MFETHYSQWLYKILSIDDVIYPLSCLYDVIIRGSRGSKTKLSKHSGMIYQWRGIFFRDFKYAKIFAVWRRNFYSRPCMYVVLWAIAMNCMVEIWLKIGVVAKSRVAKSPDTIFLLRHWFDRSWERKYSFFFFISISPYFLRVPNNTVMVLQ